MTLVMLLATIPDYEIGDEKEKPKEVIDFGENVQSLANFINNQR